ncbi:sigma-70 family RNA polymerase sigma factor [Phytohabitans sp. LJ34]|uniref:sigma-70 family RNA polymerase sigma factor n=1 Tax=Phytohabitans sp. LJ34 TaxID=3452217 RepID=UPI003F8A6627
MNEYDWMAERFEAHRGHLRAVAYRMLGSLSEADDAVQEAWLKLTRADTSDVTNLGGWLTTVVGRVCLDMLRSRRARREEPLGVHVPDPIISSADGLDPEQEALLADSVGLALLVVLEQLAPAERLAFVLHDTFAVPFEEIGPILGRTPAAAKQLASRARRRVRGAEPTSDGDLASQRAVVEAFLTAARGGDMEGLLAILDPDVVARPDTGAVVHGARALATNAITFARYASAGRLALINGVPGLIAMDGERVRSVMAFTIRGGKVTALDILVDPDRLARLDISPLG